MIIYNKTKYFPVLDDFLVDELGKKYAIKCLFGGAFSSKVYGIDNVYSDLDFYIIFDDDSKDSFHVFEEKHDVDILFINIKKLLAGPLYQRYPSILYRDKSESAINDNYHRKDFLSSQKIFEIMLSDYVWDSGYLNNNYDSLLKSICVIDVIDYYFSRAYGNYHNFIKKVSSDIPRQLRTFINICCVKWVLEKKTIPNLDIKFMINNYAPDEVGSYLYKILQINKAASGEYNQLMHSYINNDLFNVSANDINNKTFLDKPVIMHDASPVFIKYLNFELIKLSDVIRTNQEGLLKAKFASGESSFYINNK